MPKITIFSMAYLTLALAGFGQMPPAHFHHIHLNTTEPAAQILNRIGRMPLPPYIKREKSHDPRDDADRDRNQATGDRSEGSRACRRVGGVVIRPPIPKYVKVAGTPVARY